jgi:septal ring factor EnvC (AmiA/AmiB activator)
LTKKHPTQENENTPQEKILREIKNNPNITRKELSIHLDMTSNGIKYHTNARFSATNENLTATNAMLTVTNENLTATNGKLTATNARFSATNENLAATNARLTATNKNLTATNARLSATNTGFTATNKKLSATNGDLAAISVAETSFLREDCGLNRRHFGIRTINPVVSGLMKTIV